MLLLGTGSTLGTTVYAHAQAAQTSEPIAVSQVRSTQRSAQTPAGQSPYSILQYCLGTSLFGVSNTIANWSVSGHAINSCPVAIRSGLIQINSSINCPYGTSSSIGSVDLAPLQLNSGSGFDWGARGTADCFDCTDGIMTATPAYSETVSAGLDGTGTNNVVYRSEPPDTEVTIPMKQFPRNTPC